MAPISTTDHAAISYDQPVLADPDTGTAYGPDGLLTTAQAAALLGIGAAHLRRLMAARGVGRALTPRLRVLTVAEAEGLRAHLRPGRGRPKGGRTARDG